MKHPFRISNLLWIAVVLFLLWFFLWPVSLTDSLPEDEDLQVNVLGADEEETIYRFSAGSEAWTELRDILSQYPCYRSISPNSKNTNQQLDQTTHILIQSAHCAIYTYGSNKIMVDDHIFRMGWFSQTKIQTFFAELTDLLATQTPQT